MDSHQLFSLTNLHRVSPRQKKLLALGLLVLCVHLWLLLNAGDSLWRLNSESQKLGPLQTRVIAPLSATPEKAPPTTTAQRPTPTPTPKPPPAPASGPMTTPAGLSAASSSALPEPLKTPDHPPPMAPEAPPVTGPTPANTEAVASLPEKVPEAPPAQTPQDQTLVAKPGQFPDNIQINYKLTGQER